MKSATAFRAVNLLYFSVICLMAANLLLAWLRVLGYTSFAAPADAIPNFNGIETWILTE